MVSSLSNLTDKLEEGPYIGKYKDCKSSLEYTTAKDGLLTCTCLECNKTYGKKFDEGSFKRFEKAY